MDSLSVLVDTAVMQAILQMDLMTWREDGKNCIMKCSIACAYGMLLR